MKQRITPEQLNELSEKGKRILREWEINRNYAPYHGPSISPSVPIEEKWYRLIQPTIGQMIEFLDERWQPDIVGYYNGAWKVIVGDNIEVVGEELCDALWKAVKDVLESEE